MDFKKIQQKGAQLYGPFLTLFIIYTLSFYSIIRANFSYLDDLSRAVEGYREWNNFSRYMSVYLSVLFHTDTYLMDISPLLQIIASAILALSSTIIILIYTEGQVKISFWHIAAVLPLGLSPFFLECIAFKFDAPYMAISIFAMVFPLLLERKSIPVYSMAVFLGTLLMCTTYQTSSGILPMIVISRVVTRWNSKDNFRSILYFVLSSVTAYITGLLAFKLLILSPFDWYVSSSIFPARCLLKGIWNNLTQYHHLVSSGLRSIWKILICIILLGYITVTVLQSQRSKFTALLIAIVAALAMYVVSFGAYLVLELPTFSPRGMYSCGVWITVMAIQCCNSRVLNKRYFIKLSCCFLSWNFIVFSFIFGNALSEQKRYTDFRIHQLIADINDCNLFSADDEKVIQISGSIGDSPAIQAMTQRYVMLDRLIPDTFSDSVHGCSDYYFLMYFGIQNVHQDFSQDMNDMDLPVLKDTIYHTIKSDNTNILVQLKNTPNCEFTW